MLNALSSISQQNDVKIKLVGINHLATLCSFLSLQSTEQSKMLWALGALVTPAESHKFFRRQINKMQSVLSFESFGVSRLDVQDFPRSLERYL